LKSLLRIFAVLRKEFLQLSRDRLTFGMIVGIPLVLLTLFGYAINTDVRNLEAGFADQAGTALSREVLADMQASQVVNFAFQVDTPEQLLELMDAGKISLGVYIPQDFDRRVISGERKAAQIMVDGSDPIILGVGQQLTAIPVRLGTHTIQWQNNLFELRNFYNPERRTAVNIVPGLVGVILTMTMVLFTAVAIVREKERGNLELLINTPVKTVELMLGKIVPYVVIGLLQVAIILLAGWFLFQVPVRGMVLDVYLAAALFIVANLALGLLFSTLANTQFQAMQMTFFFFLPSILLSGFMFPFDGMPHIAQSVAEVLPLTHFIRLIRGIALRGAELGSMMEDVQALGVFAVIAMSLAIARFSKRLD
jgi:ABC-2 type transport system permease protein